MLCVLPQLKTKEKKNTQKSQIVSRSKQILQMLYIPEQSFFVANLIAGYKSYSIYRKHRSWSVPDSCFHSFLS